MKILQINAAYGNLSTGRTCLEMRRELERLGNQCFTAYALHNGDYQNTFVIGNSLDRKIHTFGSKFFGLQGYFSVHSTKNLIKYIERQGFDIIHLRNLHNSYINLKILLEFLAKRRIPTVITLHDCWMYTGKCMHYSVRGCYLWQKGCEKCQYIAQDMPSYFFDFAGKMLADKKRWLSQNEKLAVIGVSDWITHEAEKSILKDAKIIRRIYNWIDLDVFKYTENNLKDMLGVSGKKVVLGVSTGWTRAKGIQDIYALAEKFGKETVFVLVGNKQFAAEPKENVIHLDATDDIQRLAMYYSMADCFISMSKEESFGKTVAEAMACGTPVVVYNSTALPELVGDQCGYVAEVEKEDDFYEKVKQVLNDGKSRYAQPCRRNAEQKFDLHKNIAEYIQVYQQLL